MANFIHISNYYIHLFLLCLFFCTVLHFSAPAQAINFTRSNNVLIHMRGGENAYSFVGKYFDGRYNSRLRRFEFQMPLYDVYATNSATEMNVFNTVFLADRTAADLTEGFKLFAYLDESVPSFTEFRNGRSLVLKGECTIGGIKYIMPVKMQVRYLEGALYYSLDTEILYNFQKILIPAAADGVELKFIQVYLSDGVIRMQLEG